MKNTLLNTLGGMRKGAKAIALANMLAVSTLFGGVGCASFKEDGAKEYNKSFNQNAGSNYNNSVYTHSQEYPTTNTWLDRSYERNKEFMDKLSESSNIKEDNFFPLLPLDFLNMPLFF